MVQSNSNTDFRKAFPPSTLLEYGCSHRCILVQQPVHQSKGSGLKPLKKGEKEKGGSSGLESSSAGAVEEGKEDGKGGTSSLS